MEPGVRPSGVRLSGWKEIAGHLGRTVRTVQRWEQELGLPVRRLSTGKGETVFAYADDLDRWISERATADAKGAREHPTAERGTGGNGNGTGITGATNPGPLPAAGPAVATISDSETGTAQGRAADASSRWRRPLIAGILAAATLLLVAVLAVLLALNIPSLFRSKGAPAAFRREGHLLTIFDAEGRELWRYVSKAEPNEEFYRLLRPDEKPVLFEDLEGDGRLEVIFLAVRKDFGYDKVLVFEDDGTLRFGWGYDGRKRFGDATYSAPWALNRINVRHAGGRAEVWVTVFHRPWFPSALVRLDARGKATAEFWHPGFISSMTPATFGGREVVLVGAGNNEFRSPALAVIDPAGPSATAPATRDYYSCADCPSGRPLRYLLFPKTTMSREFNVVANAPLIAVDAAGQVVVTVDHLGTTLPGEDQPRDARAHYIFDKHLVPISAEFGDSYVREYRRLEVAGRFKRPLLKDDVRELWPVLEWNGSEFVPLPVPK